MVISPEAWAGVDEFGFLFILVSAVCLSPSWRCLLGLMLLSAAAAAGSAAGGAVMALFFGLSGQYLDETL